MGAGGKLLVQHVAVRVLPLPASATAAQPAIDVAPSLKLTVPVGAVPVTVAVNVTLAPDVDGFSELASVVVRRGGIDDLRQRAAGRRDVAGVAGVGGGDAVRAGGQRCGGTGGGAGVAAAGQRNGAQPAIDVAPSLKLTVPVGAVPVTVAVNVTLAPTVDGVSEVATVSSW